MPSLQFCIELLESNPKVWRRIVVPYEYTFYKFHLAIQGAFGWENYHLFQFSENGFLDKVSYAELAEDINNDPEYIQKNAKRAKIKLVFNLNEEFIYIYDFGIKWSHQIVYEKILDEEIERPYCIDGGGACPPEDCGGLEGYARIIEILNTPEHLEKESQVQWLGLVKGEKWDVNFCSLREINKRLCLIE